MQEQMRHMVGDDEQFVQKHTYFDNVSTNLPSNEFI